jgi:hypothetical protein
MAKEPCSVCGDETATGSVLYSSRREVQSPDGPLFLCEECSRLARGHKSSELTPEQLRRLRETASLFGKSDLPTGHIDRIT